MLLLDGARGTGKTSLLLTMSHRWNSHDHCNVERHDHHPEQYKSRVARLGDRLQFTPAGTIPTHIHPLRILDFDPLPPQMPLVAGIIQAWQPLADRYDELSGLPMKCDDQVETLRDRWDKLFRVATVGWSAVPAAKGLLEQVLDRQEQVIEWQRLGQHWHDFVREVIKWGRRLGDHHTLVDEPIFVIMIDDVDLQVERIRELLPALRMLYHPNVAFLVAAHWDHLVHTLKLDFLGQQNRLANRHTVSSAPSAANDSEWAATLAIAAASKVFPLKNKWILEGLTLDELLRFPNYGNDVDKLANGGTSARPTMKMILNGWPRPTPIRLGDYLDKMAEAQNDPYDISRFRTYRNAHQIYENASMKSDESARAIEAVRCLISDPESEAVTLGNREKRGPIVEYRGGGQLAALFGPDQVEEMSASSGVVLSARPDFTYRKEPSSDAISMRGYVGTEVNFTSAMLAVTIRDALYDVAASGLQWNVILALVWTRVRILEGDSFVKLAFQWRFHEHPHPFQLLQWSHEWRLFVRTLQDSPAHRLERIAYAWIHYQLKWLEVEVDGLPSPLAKKSIPPSHWKKLLTVISQKGNDNNDKEWELGASQNWRTQTLPLLARPEVGLPPTVQSQLLRFVDSDTDSKVRLMRCEWLDDQRKRLITDAIIAAGEEEGRRAENAENTARVEHIVTALNAQYLAAHGKDSPWLKIVDGVLNKA